MAKIGLPEKSFTLKKKYHSSKGESKSNDSIFKKEKERELQALVNGEKNNFFISNMEIYPK